MARSIAVFFISNSVLCAWSCRVTDFNPYAPPPTSNGPPRVRRHRLQKYVFLACVFVLFGAPFVARPAKPLMGSAFHWLGPVLILLAFCGCFASWASWIVGSWRAVPKALRGQTSPLASLVLYLVPGLNLWWAFAYNRRLARGLRERLRAVQTPVKAPTLLAWVSPAFYLSFCVFLSIGIADRREQHLVMFTAIAVLMTFFMFTSPFVLFAWMFRVDQCLEEL